MSINSDYLVKSNLSYVTPPLEKSVCFCMGVFCHREPSPDDNRIVRIEIYESHVTLEFSTEKARNIFKTMAQTAGYRFQRDEIDPLSKNHVIEVCNLVEALTTSIGCFRIHKELHKDYMCIPLLNWLYQNNVFNEAASSTSYLKAIESLELNKSRHA